MSQRLVEVGAGLRQEVHHRLLTNLGTHGQGIDKHAHRVTDAQVATAIADGGDANLLVVGEARERIEHRGQREVGRREVVLFAENLYGTEVQRTEYFTGRT